MAKDNRIYADRAEYLKSAVKKRRQVLKQKAVNLLGGKCQVCGYSRDLNALEFHHINPDTKSFGLSNKGLTRSWQRVEQEVRKCALLCANCHREVHSNILQLSAEMLR